MRARAARRNTVLQGEEGDGGKSEISRINLGLSRAGAPSYRLEKISIGILSHGIYYRDQLSQSLSAPLIARYSLA